MGAVFLIGSRTFFCVAKCSQCVAKCSQWGRIRQFQTVTDRKQEDSKSRADCHEKSVAKVP